MQTSILEQYPTGKLRVYAVWLPMLWLDTRGMWDGNNMPDPRVTHFWDGQRIIGKWFASEVDDYQGISWDAYYLYGPDATWAATPSPLVASGGPIYPNRAALQAKMTALLGK